MLWDVWDLPVLISCGGYVSWVMSGVGAIGWSSWVMGVRFMIVNGIFLRRTFLLSAAPCVHAADEFSIDAGYPAVVCIAALGAGLWGLSSGIGRVQISEISPPSGLP